ncbi:hypothetical protein M9H77_07384 [Catharanthus roseus]|uniref:Uncharacterized protein n=1 Tax=Catharanthus roseus TaxID=4058 RepID=A0ACC0BV02_CATRO|nr:hypothetical protein M9H77_07384 [Catharanthus roseus]
MLDQVSATGSFSPTSIPATNESKKSTTTKSEKGTTDAQANVHPVLDHGLTKDTATVAASSSLGLHNELPIQSNVPIVNVVYLSLPVLQGHGHQSQLAASQFLPVLQGHGQQSQQVASKVPHRFHGVSDDMLQHSRDIVDKIESAFRVGKSFFRGLHDLDLAKDFHIVHPRTHTLFRGNPGPYVVGRTLRSAGGEFHTSFAIALGSKGSNSLAKAGGILYGLEMIVYIYREANKVDDALAKFGCDSEDHNAN